MSDTVLEITDVKVEFPTQFGSIFALDVVSLSVRRGEAVAVVGESGCGKTTLARCALGLQPIKAGSIVRSGQRVNGVRRNQASEVGIVWQDPYASLDPHWKVGRSIVEPMRLLGREASPQGLFRLVGLDERLIDRFPHQLSGGQRQRVAIGRALAANPPLVICDEPTAALDLSIRAQILNLLSDLRREKKCSFLYISHDLTTVRFIADRVAVMYLGRIVEEGPTEEIFNDPRHPYTKALLDAAPSLDKLRHLPEALPGEIPDATSHGEGCRFAGRCSKAQEICARQDPAATKDGDRLFTCHYPWTAQIPSGLTRERVV